MFNKVWFGFRGKWYDNLNQPIAKMLGEIEYDLSRIPPIMEEELKAYIKRSVNNVTGRFTQYTPFPPAKKNLQSRSGRAKSELKGRQTVRRTDANKFNAKFLGSVKGPDYLNIQEDGGTLTASSGYIAIPLAAALDANGLPIKKSPREWKKTFIKRTKKGNLVMFGKKGRKIIPLYVLKTSVEIPARLGLRKGFENSAPYFERKMMDRIDRLMLHK